MKLRTVENPVAPAIEPPFVLKVPALLGGVSTNGMVVDLETNSEGPFIYNPETKVWERPYGKMGTKVSCNPLLYCGPDGYALSESTTIECMSCVFPDGTLVNWIRGEELDSRIWNWLASDKPIIAFNASFERPVFFHIGHQKLGWPEVLPHRWVCLQVKSVVNGFHNSLDGVCKQLAIGEKDPMGKEAMLRLTRLNNLDKNENGTPHLRLEDDPALATQLFKYCDQDALISAELNEYLTDLTDNEQRYFSQTQAMNQYGIGLDVPALKIIYRMAEDALARLDAKLIAIVDNPELTSINMVGKIASELTAWLHMSGIQVTSVAARELRMLRVRVQQLPQPPEKPVLELIDLRLALSSPALSKARAGIYRTCPDGRVRGTLESHGTITGRAKSTGLQVHNLPSREPFKSCRQCSDTECGAFFKNSSPRCPDCKGRAFTQVAWSHYIPEYILGLIKRLSHEPDTAVPQLEERLGDALPLLSMCLRPCFIAAEGYEFVSSDYISIEPRILAWTSGEDWRKKVFRTHGHIYEASGAQSFGIPIKEVFDYKKEHGVAHPCRAVGKLREMACSYLGGVKAAMEAPGAENFTQEALQKEVAKWREQSPSVVALANRFYKAAISAVRQGLASETESGPATEVAGIKFKFWRDSLVIRYPSNRRLRLHQPRIIINDWDLETIKYSPFTQSEQVSKGKEISKPKLIATIIQGIARDILYHAIDNVTQAGYQVVLTVHDEILVEAPIGTLSVETLEKLMNQMPDWAETDGEKWPIKAAGGWTGKRFRK